MNLDFFKRPRPQSLSFVPYRTPDFHGGHFNFYLEITCHTSILILASMHRLAKNNGCHQQVFLPFRTLCRGICGELELEDVDVRTCNRLYKPDCALKHSDETYDSSVGFLQ